MTVLDLVAIFGISLVVLAIGGWLAELPYAGRPSDRRHQARRVR